MGKHGVCMSCRKGGDEGKTTECAWLDGSSASKLVREASEVALLVLRVRSEALNL